jgi:hypothetical protein
MSEPTGTNPFVKALVDDANSPITIMSLLTMANILGQCLYIAAELGIADLLVKGPQPLRLWRPQLMSTRMSFTGCSETFAPMASSSFNATAPSSTTTRPNFYEQIIQTL